MHQTIATKLMHLRKSKGLTQTELARRIGVTSAAISALEKSCNRRPSPELAKKLAHVFEINLDELVGD